MNYYAVSYDYLVVVKDNLSPYVHLPMTIPCGLIPVDCTDSSGLFSVDCFLWTVSCGLFTVDCFPWTVSCGLFPVH